jgi:apolipoprotein N-acyltransferase
LKVDSTLLRVPEALVLGALFALAYRFPGALGGWLEVTLTFLFPALLLEAVFRGRHLAWTYLTLFLGLVGIFYWMPHTIQTKGNLSFLQAYSGAALFFGWEAGGFLGVAWVGRLGHRRGGLLGAAFGTALAMLVWEVLVFHVYTWSWGSALGALPWTARSAAFVGTYGLSALIWGCAAATASALAEGVPKRALGGAGAFFGVLALLSLGWYGLRRDPPRVLDIAMVQPNWEPGLRLSGMEEELWQRSDAVLANAQLPKPGRPTLLLWPESAVLGVDQMNPDPRLREAAKRRGVAWLFGTEGGPQMKFNLVRGEVSGQASFVQAKTEPMAFGERMPGPEFLRNWLDAQLGFHSQEPGDLTAQSGFTLPTPQGPLVIHPLICNEALLPDRARQGLALTGAELLTNHTNDGWFENSPATDQHAVQIRLRAVELGVPLVRATSTGKSGLYREDGSGGLWGQPMTAATYAFPLEWRPIRTPARSPWVFRLILTGLCLGVLLTWRRP